MNNYILCPHGHHRAVCTLHPVAMLYTQDIATIKNLGNPILNGTKLSWDCTPDVLLQLLRTCTLVLVSVVLDTHIKCVDKIHTL